MRPRLCLATILILLVLGVPATAVADPPQGGHGEADAQASKQQATDGPTRPGIAWERDLGVELANEPDDYILTNNDRFLVQGRAVSDVPQTPEDESDTSRGYLMAIDPSDGTDAWDAPAMDIAYGCEPVATSDDRIIAHLQPNSVINPNNFNEDLVALDATTGELLTEQRYSPPETDQEPRLHHCVDRLVLTPDETTVIFTEHQGGEIRAIDISSSPWTQSWVHLTEDDQGRSPAPTNQQIVLSEDGSTLYVLLRTSWPDPTQWTVRALDAETGAVVDDLDVPGAPRNTESVLVTDGSLVVSMQDCGPGTANTPDCVLRINDDAGNLSTGWTATLDPDDDSTPSGFSSLTDVGNGLLAGWASGGLWALAAETGEIAWSHATSSFSNNGFQLISDPDGNLYYGTFGGNFVESVSPDGSRRWQVPDCHVQSEYQSGDSKVIGPISADGTLLVRSDRRDIQGELLFGFRDGADLPKGECPEQETRVEGLGRVETSVEISEVSFPQPDSADTVVLATAFNYPDALAGGPLARRLDAPLLLTTPDALSPPTRAEIGRLGARNAVLLGGTAALSTAVEAELRDDMGLTIDRIAGANRFATAAMIADRVPETTVYVTEGANADPNRGWPDAVAVSGLASFEQRPILLVTRDRVPDETRQALQDLGATDAVVVGGTAAVSAMTAAGVTDPDGDGSADVAVVRESGPSRYATSVAIAERSVAAGASTFDLWFATGLAFPDALAAGPAVARSGGVLLLVHGRNPDLGAVVYDWLEGLDRDRTLRGWLIGGESAITAEVASRLAAAAGLTSG